MLWAIIVVFLVMWMIGMLWGAGGFIHLLLMVALALFLFGLIRGRTTL